MKITRFLGRSLHGHLDLDIEFFDDLTFITGKNGSGKTTVLNLIASILLPRLDYLAAAHFDTFSIDFVHNDELVTLSARATQRETVIECSNLRFNRLPIPPFVPSEPLSPHRLKEFEEEHYQDILLRNSENDILRYIQGLPTPMYLGLDRRSLSLPSSQPRLRRNLYAHTRLPRRIFGRSIEAGLDDALLLARQHIHDVRRDEVALDAQFRERMVLELIDFPPISFSGKIEKPSKAELAKFEEAKKNLRRLPNLLNVDADVIASKIDPVINFLDETLKKIEEADELEKEFAMYEWSFNAINIDRLSTLSRIISDYNRERDLLRRRINDYLGTANKFITDNGKEIVFDGNGDIRIILRGNDEDVERHIYSLSSGEIQMIVILTHLYFDPEIERENVFIIDEPELSLHVQWQEKFVDSIMEASATTQFILATHSPTIILDKVEHCCEISKTW